MERLTREQIARIFNQEELNPEEVLDLIKDELGIEIDPSLDKETQIDEVFRIYNETLDKLDEKKKEQAQVYSKKKKKVKLTRKDYIQELISKGEYTKDEVIALTDDYFDYEEGKSSRSRVGRVIREMKHEGTIVQDKESGILSTK